MLVRASSGLILLFLTLVGATILGVGYGPVWIPPQHSVGILLDATRIFHITPTWKHYEVVILLDVRLPGVAAAILVGAALGVSGTLFQGLLRNPLADPLLLGTSSGAALGATFAFLLPTLFTATWLGFSFVAIAAFVGALLSVALVYALASRHGQTPVVTLLLAGVAVSAMITALQTLLITFSTQLGLRLNTLYNWITGSISGTWPEDLVVACIVAVGLVAAIIIAPVLDAFALGEPMAGFLGVDVERTKRFIVVLASFLVAAAVSISGLVGFVGLVAPHVCRLILGPRHRLLLPSAALAGASFVVLADLLARSLVAPAVIPLSVITALAGGPFFLWLLSRVGQVYSS